MIPERRALLSGDLVSALSTMLIDPDTGDMDAYLASLDRAAAAGAKVLLPAHGPPLPVKALAQVRDHRLAREASLVEALAGGPSSLERLARSVYADTPDVAAFLSERQTLAHLIRLRRAGRARQTDAGWEAV
jgi:glyoxylase-like metal-dependent hydrolase (beta-lactamase superfamily II)